MKREEVAKYYRQLPKDLREKWADFNGLNAIVYEHFKAQYPEDRIYKEESSTSLQGQHVDIEEAATDMVIELGGANELYSDICSI